MKIVFASLLTICVGSVYATTLPATNVTTCSCSVKMKPFAVMCHKAPQKTLYGGDLDAQGNFANPVQISTGTAIPEFNFNDNGSIHPAVVTSFTKAPNAPVMISYLDDQGNPTSLDVIQMSQEGEVYPVALNASWFDASTCKYTGPVPGLLSSVHLS